MIIANYYANDDDDNDESVSLVFLVRLQVAIVPVCLIIVYRSMIPHYRLINIPTVVYHITDRATVET